MKDELVSKLSSALSESIEKESQVVYILAEIRKLLDRTLGDKKRSKYPVLNFYCNWALHVEIGDTTAVNPILDEIEQLLVDSNNMPEVMFNFINLEALSKNLGDFLAEYGIENPLNKYVYRGKFRDLLIGVLRDCPLKPKNRKITEFCFKKSDKNRVFYLVQFENAVRMNGFDSTQTAISGSFIFN